MNSSNPRQAERFDRTYDDQGQTDGNSYQSKQQMIHIRLLTWKVFRRKVAWLIINVFFKGFNFPVRGAKMLISLESKKIFAS